MKESAEIRALVALLTPQLDWKVSENRDGRNAISGGTTVQPHSSQENKRTEEKKPVSLKKRTKKKARKQNRTRINCLRLFVPDFPQVESISGWRARRPRTLRWKNLSNAEEEDEEWV